MLATLPSQPPALTVAGFVYEPKYDGIRAIVEVVPGTDEGGRALVVAQRQREDRAVPRHRRRGWRVGPRPGRARWCSTARSTALDADGEPTGFQRLQHRIHVSVPGYRSNKAQLSPDEQPVALIVFDLLRDGDDDLRPLPLTERRARLEALFGEAQVPLHRRSA